MASSNEQIAYAGLDLTSSQSRSSLELTESIPLEAGHWNWRGRRSASFRDTPASANCRSSEDDNEHDLTSMNTLVPVELNDIPQAHSEVEKAPREVLPRKRISSTIEAWWLETTAIVISIASLISIVVLLFVYQDQPLSSWPYRYQPNSVVSQLTTVARSTMMLSVASCISQSLWLHIEQRPRKILDIQTFDKASRGPAGAVVLLTCATKYSLVAVIGSFITIATLFMDSSTQQLLRYPFRGDIGALNATFPVTQHYIPTFYTNTYGWNGQLDGDIQAAIIDSMFGRPYADSFSCPTNSCPWDTMAATLGVCSNCTDVTNTTEESCHVVSPAGYCNYTTPGHFVLNTSAVGNAETSQSTMIRTVANDGQGIVSFASLIQGVPPSITECQLSFCAKVYRNASVKSGNFAAEVESYGFPNGSSQSKIDGGSVDTFLPGQDFPTSLDSTFSVNYDPTHSLTRYLVSILNTGNEQSCSGSCLYTPVTDALSFGAAMLNQPSIPDVAENLARSLTNVIRNSTRMNGTQALGKSTEQVQFFEIRWEWIISPSTVILLSLCILLITMIQSHNSNSLTWRSSPLAMLFHPLQGWSEDELYSNSTREMEKLSGKMHGQLRHNNDGGIRIVKS